MPNRSTSRGVFVNCPFDPDYKEQFDALIFAIYDCGFYPRCALEIADSGGVRFEKICELIQECRYGIHDLSRIQIDSATQLPRFNMPLELGLFLGAKKFSGRTKRRKVCLVMDTERYRYRNFCSDLAGVDIEAHSGDILELVRVVRNWLRTNQEVEEIIPSGDHISERYKQFLAKLPEFCERFRLNPKAIIFRDYISVLEAWLLEHDWRAPQTS
jgi:hypothetical protein